MKILVTGFSSQQNGTVPRLGYVVVPECIAQALADAGHYVERRRVAYDEDVTDFDVVFVGLIPPLAFAAHKVYSALKLLDNLHKTQTPTVLFVDDPSYYKFSHNLNTVSREPSRMFREKVFSKRPDYDIALEEKDLITTLIRNMTDQNTWPPLLMPAYEWGDRTGMRNIPPKALFADPSGYVPRYPIKVAMRRERHWVLGALVNAQYWLERQKNIHWPVEMYGSNETRNICALSEASLVQRFGETWGILTQPRPEVRASGWWRTRYLFGAWAGSVVSGEPRDLAPLGPAYTEATPDVVEQMTDAELAELAAKQAAVFNSYVWDKPKYQQALDNIAQQARDERWCFSW